MTLTNEQRAAVTTNHDKVVIVASAACGKTRIITERVRFLLENGVTPSKIVVITFTNAAADEMRKRIGSMGDDCFIGTIHSYANRLLLKKGVDTGRLIQEGALLDTLPELRVIAAHFGGYLMWDRAKRSLVGRNVWLDTSSAIPFMGSGEAAEIIEAHGADRILWGSDYPAVQPQTAIAQLESLGLPTEDQEKIFYRNAEKLLNIRV